MFSGYRNTGWVVLAFGVLGVVFLALFSGCKVHAPTVQAQERQDDLILQWKRAVVLLETKTSEGAYVPIGTGFLVRDENAGVPPLLVTARHMLFDNEGNNYQFIWVGVNSTDPKKGRLRFAIPLFDNKGSVWRTAPRIDVAALPIQLPRDADVLFIPLSGFGNSATLKEGRHILVVGFPGGIPSEWGTPPIITPLFRTGVIAWFPSSRVDTTISDKFFVDASIYGGNSGSPVLLDPLIQADPNVIAPGQTSLLGVITETRVREFKVVLKPEAVAMAFSANIGVAVPSDKIKEVVLLFATKKK